MFLLRTLAAALAGFLLLLLSLLLAVVTWYPVVLQDHLARFVSAVIGRQVTIDGQLELRLVPPVQISVTGLRLANTTWGSQPDMLAAERLLIEVDPASLGRGTWVFPRVEVDGLDLSLEQSADGQSNWDFDLQMEDQPGLEPPAVLIQLFTAPGARVRLAAPRLAAPVDFQFTRLEQRPVADGMLALDVEGQANTVPLRLQGAVGPAASLIAGQDIRLALSAALGDLDLAASGHIDALAHPRDTSLDFRISGPDAGVLTDQLGLRGLGRGAVDMAGTVAALDDGRGVSIRVAGQVGEFSVQGEGQLGDSATEDPLEVRAEVSGPDLALLGAMAGQAGWPEEAFQLAVDLQRQSGRLTINRATLKLSAGDEADLQGTLAPDGTPGDATLRLSARGPDLGRLRELLPLPGTVGGAYALQGSLVPGADDTRRIKVAVQCSLGQFTVDGPLGAAPDYYGTRLAWTARGPSLQAVGKAVGLAGWPAGAYSAQGGLDWTQPGIVLRKASLQLGRDQLQLDGLVGNRPLGQQLNLKVALKGNDAAILRRLLGQPALPPGPYSVAGGVSRGAAPGSALNLDALQVRLAGAQVRLDGRLAVGATRVPAELKLAASGPDLSAFSALAGVALPRSSFSLAGQLASGRNSLQLAGPATLALGALKGQVTATIGQPLGSAPVRFDLGLRGPGLGKLLPPLVLTPLLQDPLDLEARGSWQPGRWQFDQLRVQTPRGNVSLAGTLIPGPASTRLDLRLKAEVQDPRATGRLFQLNLPAAPLSLAARLQGDTSSLQLRDLQAEWGGSDLAGQLGLKPGRVPQVDASLEAQLLDLTSLLPAATVPDAAGGSPFIPAVPLPLELLAAVNGRVDLRAQTLRYAGASYSGVRLAGTLQDGTLRADPVAITTPNGKLSGQLSIQPGGPGGATVRVRGTGTDMHLGRQQVPDANLNRLTATVDLAGQGRDTRALAATLNGSLRLVGNGGQLDNRLLQKMYSDFLTQLVNTLNPLAKRQPYTQVVCAAYLFRAEDGILRTDPALVVRTDSLDIVANGTINLRSEAVDFSFKTAPRTGFGFSLGGLLNPYVKVSGTLARPRLTLDPKGTLVNGGAAFATGGLSIVATTLWDRVVHKKDPCASAIAVADQRAASAP